MLWQWKRKFETQERKYIEFLDKGCSKRVKHPKEEYTTKEKEKLTEFT